MHVRTCIRVCVCVRTCMLAMCMCVGVGSCMGARREEEGEKEMERVCEEGGTVEGWWGRGVGRRE